MLHQHQLPLPMRPPFPHNDNVPHVTALARSPDGMQIDLYDRRVTVPEWSRVGTFCFEHEMERAMFERYIRNYGMPARVD